MIRSVPVLVLAAVVALGAGCTAESADAPLASEPSAAVDRSTLADELAAAYSGDHAEPSVLEDGECFADALLDAVGVDELRDEGLITAAGHLVDPLPSLDDDLAGPWVDAQQTCSDFIASSVEALAAQSKGAIDRRAYAACLRDELTDAQIRAGLTAAVTGDLQGDAVARLGEAQQRCSSQAQSPN